MSWSKRILFGDKKDWDSNIQHLDCPHCDYHLWWQIGNYGGEADDLRNHIKNMHPDTGTEKNYGEAE